MILDIFVLVLIFVTLMANMAAILSPKRKLTYLWVGVIALAIAITLSVISINQ